MLYTNLKHIESATQHANIISENENVLVICGRMSPICIEVYRIVEELEEEYRHVNFYDMEFDNPESHLIGTLPEVAGFTGVPFTIYYKNGQMVKSVTGTQTKSQITAILDNEFTTIVYA